MTDQTERTNGEGMREVWAPPGRYRIGSDEGDSDERPAHEVALTRGFWMGATEVTNAQYERFDPAHRALRGERGLSAGDDEAVVHVSWREAAA